MEKSANGFVHVKKFSSQKGQSFISFLINVSSKWRTKSLHFCMTQFSCLLLSEVCVTRFVYLCMCAHHTSLYTNGADAADWISLHVTNIVKFWTHLKTTQTVSCKKCRGVIYANVAFFQTGMMLLIKCCFISLKKQYKITLASC